ncbi:MAG: hypothetical protein R3E04_06600 [Sphingobium sp.]
MPIAPATSAAGAEARKVRTNNFAIFDLCCVHFCDMCPVPVLEASPEFLVFFAAGTMPLVRAWGSRLAMKRPGNANKANGAYKKAAHLLRGTPLSSNIV